MSTKRATLEKIAPTIDEAIQIGLEELRLPREAVEIEILDEGSRGLFGLGSRQARVRLTVKQQRAQEVRSSIPMTAEAAPEMETKPIPASIPLEPLQGEDEQALQTAQQTVNDLLEKMHVTARVTARYGQPDEMHPRVPIHVDITGKDLAILIGRKAETLNALQYISSLIASKELGHAITLIVDVEGYRERRYNQIRQIARRMADQAIKTGRRQIMEPMPANERRIIHMELRENPMVKTESIGEEPHRKVTIIPVQ